MTERPRVYHLAWHSQHVTDSDQLLVYVLVPVWLGVFRGSLEMDAINAYGRPVPKIWATMKDLASPRRPEDTEGFGSSLRDETDPGAWAGEVSPDPFP